MYFSRRSKKFAVFVLTVFCLLATFAITLNTAHAGSGGIRAFSVNSEMNVHVEVSCPGDRDYTWQVALDSFGSGQIIMEQTTPVFDFTLRQFADRISNGRHDLELRVRCGGESWDQATYGRTTFDWNGGNPPPVNPPIAAPGTCNVSINPGSAQVPPNTPLNFTVNANCTGNGNSITTRIFVNGNWADELGSPTLHYTWPGAGSGTHRICGQGHGENDPNWEHRAEACATVTVTSAVAVPQVTTPVFNPEAFPTNVPNIGAQLPRYAEARQSGTNGGVDVIVYCFAAGYTGATNRDETQDGFGCTFASGDFIPLVWANVCRDVWGPEYGVDRGNGGRNDLRCRIGAGNGGANVARAVTPVTNNPVVRATARPVNVQPEIVHVNRESGAACDVDSVVAVGDTARVTPGAPNRIRSQATVSSSQIGSIPGGGEFTVIGGSVCADGYRWVQVNYQGIEGWTAEGNNEEYWIEKVIYPQPSESAANNRRELVTYEFTYNSWRHSYRFVLDPNTCLIVNGSEVIANEVSRFAFWAQNASIRNRVDYFMVDEGGIEDFRHYVENLLTAGTGCGSVRYQVGSKTMDTSGLGNIVFGYDLSTWPSQIEDAIANIAQGANSQSRFIFRDMEDDVTQRRTGRYIAQTAGRASVSPALVEQAANDAALS